MPVNRITIHSHWMLEDCSITTFSELIRCLTNKGLSFIIFSPYFDAHERPGPFITGQMGTLLLKWHKTASTHLSWFRNVVPIWRHKLECSTHNFLDKIVSSIAEFNTSNTNVTFTKVDSCEIEKGRWKWLSRDVRKRTTKRTPEIISLDFKFQIPSIHNLNSEYFRYHRSFLSARYWPSSWLIWRPRASRKVVMCLIGKHASASKGWKIQHGYYENGSSCNSETTRDIQKFQSHTVVFGHANVNEHAPIGSRRHFNPRTQNGDLETESRCISETKIHIWKFSKSTLAFSGTPMSGAIDEQ